MILLGAAAVASSHVRICDARYAYLASDRHTGIGVAEYGDACDLRLGFYLSGGSESEWWPSRGGFLGLTDLWSFEGQVTTWIYYDLPTPGGADTRYGFAGITRDEYGNVLPSCTVSLHLSSTGELVQRVTSDSATGEFSVGTPYGGGHYIVVHRSDVVPPVGGATADTIVAS